MWPGGLFLSGCVADLLLSERGQPANKSLVATACKSKKDLGNDKPDYPAGPFGVSAGREQGGNAGRLVEGPALRQLQ